MYNVKILNPKNRFMIIFASFKYNVIVFSNNRHDTLEDIEIFPSDALV